MALRARPQQVRAAASAARRLLWRVGGEARAISPATVEAHLLVLRQAGKAAKTLTNARSHISTFCRFLVRRGVLKANPAAEVRLARAERIPPQYLRDDEVEMALSAARQAGIWPEVSLALATGLRVSELARLAWQDVDLERRVLLVRRSKSGRPRTLPLSHLALDALAAQREISGEFRTVFPARRTWKRHVHYMDQPRCLASWTRILAPVQKAVGRFGEVSGVGRAWHLLRHTFASRLAQAGISLYKIADWLGHSDVRMTQRYAHLATGYDPDIERMVSHGKADSESTGSTPRARDLPGRSRKGDSP